MGSQEPVHILQEAPHLYIKYRIQIDKWQGGILLCLIPVSEPQMQKNMRWDESPRTLPRMNVLF